MYVCLYLYKFKNVFQKSCECDVLGRLHFPKTRRVFVFLIKYANLSVMVENE